MRKKPTITNTQVGLKYGFRSGLEEKVAEQLEDAKKQFGYECLIISFTQPAKKRTYRPDFMLTNKNGSAILVETKGRFIAADRQKHLMIKEQHPYLDLRFVFTNPNAKISKVSKTTYAMWCDKNGFKYAAKEIPQEWLEECR